MIIFFFLLFSGAFCVGVSGYMMNASSVDGTTTAPELVFNLVLVCLGTWLMASAFQFAPWDNEALAHKFYAELHKIRQARQAIDACNAAMGRH